ncbi:unnamed protein product [Cylindrotheca closterium]|uniref:C3H1-type domain-containing protein n=2 Tax=Cylindrotheca closterium TaxID=2856 RepID=A0AAD2PX51_9STRA|nr:unnamed protein product [Cylindrotheca closterium]
MSTATKQNTKHAASGPCCFFLKYGKCVPPRGSCRFSHDLQDDGVTPCCFGPTCRLGHASRVKFADAKQKSEYWKEYHMDGNLDGDSPAVRDATLLRSQLEPWPTSTLRTRLVESFGESYGDLDGLARGHIMERLLKHYENYGERKELRVDGKEVSEQVRIKLMDKLIDFKSRHQKNTRPSISARSYMILRSPLEFEQKNSNNAKAAAKKFNKYLDLWNLAKEALMEVDPEFARNFSALAVTYGFQGSPHIDKQNTAPFYGLSLGSFPEGQGGICVEVDAFSICHVNTKDRLGKVDGRYPHWVAPYDSSTERFSLIYYSTWQEYEHPKQAYYGGEE